MQDTPNAKNKKESTKVKQKQFHTKGRKEGKEKTHKHCGCNTHYTILFRTTKLTVILVKPMHQFRAFMQHMIVLINKGITNLHCNFIQNQSVLSCAKINWEKHKQKLDIHTISASGVLGVACCCCSEVAIITVSKSSPTEKLKSPTYHQMCNMDNLGRNKNIEIPGNAINGEYKKFKKMRKKNCKAKPFFSIAIQN